MTAVALPTILGLSSLHDHWSRKSVRDRFLRPAIIM